MSVKIEKDKFRVRVVFRYGSQAKDGVHYLSYADVF
jgi:hypothetical protein